MFGPYRSRFKGRTYTNLFALCHNLGLDIGLNQDCDDSKLNTL